MVQESPLNKQKLLVLAGPTGVGKTEIALKLFDNLNCELISADSMQVYKGCDIGTAKLSKKLLSIYPHHNIDILKPYEEFNVALFKTRTLKIIEEIHSREKLPIIVGGTGLYIESLLFPYDFGNCSKNEAYRQELNQIADEYGNSKLYEILKNKDLDVATQIDKNNKHRIIRALEKLENAKSIESEKNSFENSPFDYKIIFLNKDREVLYDDINFRVDEMIKNGLLEEAKKIFELQSQKQSQLQVSSAIGYKEFFDYFNGTATLNECIEKVKQHTRNYAKRQITWYKRYTKNIEFLYNDTNEQTISIIEYLTLIYNEFKK